MDNMTIYEAGRSVPGEAQKPFDNGTFSGTDINPMWRIKKMTELFGPCGIGWYYEVVSERAEEYDNTVMAIVDIKLYIKMDGEWSKPIYGTGGNTLVKETRKGIKPSDEGYKMALTDALSVACKALGIGADIYFSKDRTKYRKDESREEPKERFRRFICSDCGKVIEDDVRRDGSLWPAAEIVEYTKAACQRVLCKACGIADMKRQRAEAEAYRNREDGAE